MRVLNATRSITLKSATPPLLVVLSSFHDDVTEVSFVWLHNGAYTFCTYLLKSTAKVAPVLKSAQQYNQSIIKSSATLPLS